MSMGAIETEQKLQTERNDCNCVLFDPPGDDSFVPFSKLEFYNFYGTNNLTLAFHFEKTT